MGNYLNNTKNFTNGKRITSEKNQFYSIRINTEYQNIVPLLTTSEYESLKSSIKQAGGNIVPIIVNKHGIILDGHHRYRACKELGLKELIIEKEFSDPIEEKEFIITINRNRRHLNSFQIAELGYKLEEIEKEKAKQRLSSAGRIGSDIRWKKEDTKSTYNYNNGRVGSNEPTLFQQEKEERREEGKTSDIIAEKIGLSPTTYFRARKIITDSSEEQKKRLREGKDSIDKVYKELQKSKKREVLINQIKHKTQQHDLLSNLYLEGKSNNSRRNSENQIVSFKLLCGDLLEKGREIPDGSIDLIFTDPPYSTEYIQIYHKLGSLANRLLKPGGSIVTYIGQHNLPEILDIFTSKDLKYWWSIAVKHGGKTRAFHQRKVFVLWKQLLWFVKGDKLSTDYPIAALNDYLYDYIESEPPAKTFHPWEQSTVETEHVIKKLTLEHHVILDPLMGSGTTGLVALKTNRNFIGIEESQDEFKIAQSRLTSIIREKQPIFLDNCLSNLNPNIKTENKETIDNLQKSSKLEITEDG